MSTFERMMRQRRYGRRARPSPWLHRPPRRRRGNVRVYGCCLPIPLGMLTAAGLGTRLFFARR
jgi:hypothetical protein